jgi:hypothetical protein
MTDDFEDLCWKDIITPETLEIYSCYKRKTFVGQYLRFLLLTFMSWFTGVVRSRHTKSPKTILALADNMPMKCL